MEPGELDREVLRNEPHSVACDRVPSSMERSSCSPFELYPGDYSSCASVNIAQKRTVLGNPKLETLLSTVGGIEPLHARRRTTLPGRIARARRPEFRDVAAPFRGRER